MTAIFVLILKLIGAFFKKTLSPDLLIVIQYLPCRSHMWPIPPCESGQYDPRNVGQLNKILHALFTGLRAQHIHKWSMHSKQFIGPLHGPNPPSRPPREKWRIFANFDGTSPPTPARFEIKAVNFWQDSFWIQNSDVLMQFTLNWYKIGLCSVYTWNINVWCKSSICITYIRIKVFRP